MNTLTLSDAWRLRLIAIIGFAISLFILVVQPTQRLMEELVLPIFFSLCLTLIFLKHPLQKTTPRIPGSIAQFVDLVLIVLSLYSSVHYVGNIERFIYMPFSTPLDIALGIGFIAAVLEAIRRVYGKTLLILALAALLYGYLGHHIPGILGHRGYELDRIVSQLYIKTAGIFGIPLKVMVRYVVFFVIFGNLLELAGGTKFFVDFSRFVAGKLAGGVAYIAVISSALMGTISGTAIANVATTGIITIPAMKKAGFHKDLAGAIEAVASTGGQIMPPIMGAAAFIMAEYLGIPYVTLIQHALVPGILYFFGIFMAVFFFARQSGIGSMQDDLDEEPVTLQSLLRSCPPFVVSLGLMILFLVLGFSPMRAALIALLGLFVVSLFRAETRLTPAKLWKGLADAGNNLAAVSVASANAGIIIGIVSLTGIGVKMTSILSSFAGDSLLLLLLLAMVISLILGMGVPTVVAYILVATLVAPAIVAYDVMNLSAHFFVLYFAIFSMITPPVAMAAYTAVVISEGDPMRTGWKALRLALPGFLIPYVIVYNPELLLVGSPFPIFVAVFTAVIGIIGFAAALQGYFVIALTPLEQVVLGIASVMLILGQLVYGTAGLVIFLLVFLRQWFVFRRQQTV